MALAEPPSTLGLWPLVRDSSVGWPETDEDAVRDLAQAWRSGAQQFADTGRFDPAPVGASWPDPAGQMFAGRVRGELDAALTTSDAMQSLANRCDHFADVVVGVKTSIRTLIESNLDRYAATRALAVEDRASVRQHFVQVLADEVNRIVGEAAGQIGGPLAADDQLPPPTEEPGDELTVAGALGDGVNGLASLGNAALNNPLATLSLVGGGVLVAGGAAAVTAGGGISLTGVGAVIGTPLAGLGAAGVATGSATVLAAGGALVAAAQNEDRVTPVAGSGTEEQPDRETALGQAKEQAGIPADAEPIDEIRNASGVQYVYEVDGRVLLVTENTMDRSHPGQGHWEVAPPKKDLTVDPYGRYRPQNYLEPGAKKIKINFR